MGKQITITKALKGRLNATLNMAQSLSKQYMHIIFHIKTTSVKIRSKEKQELYAYIGAIIKDK
ncbi:hypothetical protein TRIP_D310157 [uncultured Paludibacter sp.]|uniref:Uncharacterized protein n=1 Tax=uncultured Paludibacter sp. TaxID=497635 RepID=A0A653ACG1_9BACT|nr:hypothetical protein TRIP_D310157 [uncultured Paludibacter sp.]